MLDKYIYVPSVDTGDFYSNREAHLHWLSYKLKIERNQLKDGYTFYGNKNGRVIIGLEEIKQKLIDAGLTTEDFKALAKGDFSYIDLKSNVIKLCDLYILRKKQIKFKNEKIKTTKNKLEKLLSNKAKANIESNGTHHIRTLREDTLREDTLQINTNSDAYANSDVYANSDNNTNLDNNTTEINTLNKNIISVFDSSFTRMIGAKPNELTEDFMVIQVYYFDIIKDLIYHGFMYKGEKYIYFTSSAGQIRTKKTVFIKESVWKKHEKTIMCGLTIDLINKKGGNNPNKHLAYMALTNSATDVWDEFDIDKTIVIDDFETNVFGTYDLINDSDYSIKRISGYVPITHTDGAGMMLPQMGKNKMIRLPWIKGLLGVFDFKSLIIENGWSPVIKDVYGKEHNIITEDIQVILTKSQFKMWKYYDSWEQYKEFYRKYNCSAGYTNPEEDRIKNASINYQMLQSLTDITDDEIENIAKVSVTKLKNLCSSVENMQAAFGVSSYNINPTYFQQAIELYPNLLNDEYAKSQLRDIKNSMVKKYKSGKLRVNGKYTFVLPDFYAACEYWFGHIEQPKGLLNNGEVFCWLFRKANKLDCLRSPHLYREHAIRKNIACNEFNERQKELRKWFITNAIYTSCYDLISKMLQFDVDGDKLLVVSDETLIKVAERNMKDIVPLYYNMKKANAVELNNNTIYNGLNAAFKWSNIGLYSNNISKIWNSEVFISGTDKEKQDAIDIIKILCMENNFLIDAAKTLYMPVRPKEIQKKIMLFTKDKVPAFFKYAKDKTSEQVANINNSFVNKLDKVIPNPRINARDIGLGCIDYTLLMNNSSVECKADYTTNKGNIVKEKSNPVIVKYCELNLKYRQVQFQTLINTRIDMEALQEKKKVMGEEQYLNIRYSDMILEYKSELSQFGYTEQEITDILVKFLYGNEKKHKIALWLCYGKYIVNNLQSNGMNFKTKSVQCIDCGEWFEVKNKNNETKRCPSCYEEYRKAYYKEKKREQRLKAKMSTAQK